MQQATQILLCQLCGKNLCSEQHGKGNEANFQKLVDPPTPPYKQIIPDYRYDEVLKKKQGKKWKTGQNEEKPMCISIPVVFEQSVAKGESKKTEESQAKEKPKEKEKEKETETKAGASTATKASCLPAGGTNCPPPVKMMLCLPCPPPEGVAQSAGAKGGQGSQTACKPKDYTYRCESRELRAGNLYSCCQCVKRNGLQHDCPRTPCQGRPPCLAKPWPDCWPSGGCHGIDFTREKGTKRYNPCSAQRFDNKVCEPAGSGGVKPDCGGQMMVVVCPPQK